MTTVLAIPLLYEAVVARMDAEAAAADPPETAVPQPFGWREPARRTGTRRIVWVPGDDGDLGEFGPPRNPGRNPRSLGTIHELVTVYLEAADLTAPENELLQYTAARLLLDAWLRAVRLAAYGTFEVVSLAWVDDKNLRRHGATIRAVLSVQAMVPDEELETAPVDVAAHNTTHPSDTDEDEGELDVVSAA